MLAMEMSHYCQEFMFPSRQRIIFTAIIRIAMIMFLYETDFECNMPVNTDNSEICSVCDYKALPFDFKTCDLLYLNFYVKFRPCLFFHSINNLKP